jgi:hypothetical protein
MCRLGRCCTGKRGIGLINELIKSGLISPPKVLQEGDYVGRCIGKQSADVDFSYSLSRRWAHRKSKPLASGKNIFAREFRSIVQIVTVDAFCIGHCRSIFFLLFVGSIIQM